MAPQVPPYEGQQGILSYETHEPMGHVGSSWEGPMGQAPMPQAFALRERRSVEGPRAPTQTVENAEFTHAQGAYGVGVAMAPHYQGSLAQVSPSTSHFDGNEGKRVMAPPSQITHNPPMGTSHFDGREGVRAMAPPPFAQEEFSSPISSLDAHLRSFCQPHSDGEEEPKAMAMVPYENLTSSSNSQPYRGVDSRSFSQFPHGHEVGRAMATPPKTNG
jgi:hypothetical protein